MTGDVMDLGPIRPEHATGGRRLDGDESGRWLAFPLSADYQVRIYATTATTVARTASDGRGRVVREASARDVDDAKAAVDRWIREG